MKPRICVVGSVNMDLVFRTPRMPAVGETLHGHEFCQIPGGKGANQAVAAARFGAQVQFIGAVGNDGFGSFSQNCLSNERINIQHLRVVDNVATGVAGILVDDQGNNSIVLAAGANAEVSTAQIESAVDAILSSQVLVCQLETPLSSVDRAITIAHQQAVTVILNPAPAQTLSDELLSKVDYLVVNETEASQLSGVAVIDQVSADAAAQILQQKGVKTVLLTMGEHGVVVKSQTEQFALPAYQVDVVDTTAAGDTFVGTFAVGIASQLSLRDATAQAQAAAALAVTRLGAQSSIPSKQQVKDFIQQ